MKGSGNGFLSKSIRFSKDTDSNSVDHVYAKIYGSPGPGQYDVEKNSLSKTFSTSLSTPTKQQYVRDQLKKDASEARLKLHKQYKSENAIPGPGHYKNAEQPLKNRCQGISIPKTISKENKT